MCRPVRCLLVLALLSFFTALGQEETGDLWVKRAKLSAKGSVKVVGLLPPGEVAAEYMADGDGVELTVGSLTLLSAPPVDERATFRLSGYRRWKYREKRSQERPGRRRLKLDVARRRFVFRAKGLDVSSIVGGDPDAVPVTLRLGEQVFRTEVDFVTRRRGVVYRAPITIPFFEPYVPGGGGVNPPPDGPPANYRVLYDDCRWGCVPDCWYANKSSIVIRDRATWEKAWSDTFACGYGIPEDPPKQTPPLPSVNFGSEAVVGICPRYGFSGLFIGARILSVTEFGPGLVVTFEELEVPPGVCPGPWPFCQWALYIAVPDEGGPISLVGSERQLTEWKPWK